MNKIINFTLYIVLLLITFAFLINPLLVINTTIDTTYLFFINVFSCIFPFMILSYILIQYNVINYIALFINKLFKIDINLITLFILGIINGFPSSAKFIKYYIDKGYIDKENGYKLVSIIYFPSIMFVLGTIGSLYLNSFILGIKILLTIYITNILLLIKFRFKNSISSINDSNDKIGEVLFHGIKNSFDTMIIILGSMVIYSILVKIIDYYIPLNNTYIINSILEMSSGIKKISTQFMSTNFKAILITISLVFGGLSVHSQILSIIDIDYKEFVITRLKAILISLVIIVMFLNM